MVVAVMDGRRWRKCPERSAAEYSLSGREETGAGPDSEPSGTPPPFTSYDVKYPDT
jgi:hypothetical protein